MKAYRMWDTLFTDIADYRGDWYPIHHQAGDDAMHAQRSFEGVTRMLLFLPSLA